jgi:hypothetical protein
LLAERAYWASQETVTAGPVLLTVLGGALIVSGLVLSMLAIDLDGCPNGGASEYYSVTYDKVIGLGMLRDDPSKCGAHAYLVPGVTMLVLGGASAIGGAAILLGRTSESRKQNELQRIDANLQIHGIEVAILPWVNPSPGAGLSYGVGATGHF